MGKNYYALLGVSRLASDVDIKRAFRKLALIWHPERNPTDATNARRKFDDICEAYTVLISLPTRAIYDLHGEDVLKRGQPDGQGGFQGAWAMKDSSEEVFSKFFGANNPFMVDAALLASGQQPSRALAPVEPIRVVLYVTLEEVYTGFWISRSTSRSTRKGDCFRRVPPDQVPIRPGMAAGTRVRRQGNDLIVRQSVYIADALGGGLVRVPMLDGRTLSVPIAQVVCAGSHKKIAGEGLVGPDGQRGDLFVEFNVTYPDQIPFDNKVAIRALLPAPIAPSRS